MDTIRLLQDRVRQAVERIGELSAERERLDDELRSLRKQLQDLHLTASSRESDESGWDARRDEALTLIQKTLDELDPA